MTESGGIAPGYELKQNSYDIGVDIELADAIQRLRFEHPEVHAVVMRSGKPGIFCAGANIRMLAGATHAHKVNFCKFTNETRNAIEEASAESGQRYLAALGGTAAGGGYELALATDHLLLIDDGNAAVSLPEVPLLAVLPGTGGLTRLTDKRRIRRDLADVFCTLEEGARGARALEWGLVDEIAPRSKFDAAVRARALALAATSDRPHSEPGIALPRLERTHRWEPAFAIRHLDVVFDTTLATATLTLHGPDHDMPNDLGRGARDGRSDLWALALLRELDDALLHLRCNAPSIATLVLRSEGDLERVLQHDAWLARTRGRLVGARNPLVREAHVQAPRPDVANVASRSSNPAAVLAASSPKFCSRPTAATCSTAHDGDTVATRADGGRTSARCRCATDSAAWRRVSSATPRRYRGCARTRWRAARTQRRRALPDS